MGGFFGAVSKSDVMLDVFFGTDYHSHLGTRRGGLAAYNPEKDFRGRFIISRMLLLEPNLNIYLKI